MVHRDGTVRVRRVAALAAALSASAVVAVLPAGGASAAETTCPLSVLCTATFSYTGSAESWTVPTGVTSVLATVAGASGGNSDNRLSGGVGGELTATVPVTPGEVLSVAVGGRGADGTQDENFRAGGAGGFGGGGNGSSGVHKRANGPGGGGGSFLAAVTGTGQTLLAVAGGGGGASECGTGGSGGSGGPGTAGSGLGAGGGGGTNASGAAGGTAAPDGNPSEGLVTNPGTGPALSTSVFGVGGSGDSLPPTDLYFAQLTFGGGGGGLYGGGAGGRGVNGQDVCDGPGGGGSGLLATGSPTSTTTNTGDGFVTLTYQPTAVTTTTLSSAAGTVLLGGSVSYTATVAAGPTPISAGTVAFSDAGRTIPTCAAASLSAGGTATCTVTYPAVGSHPITATYSGAPGFAGSHAGLTQAVAYGQQVLSYSAASGRGGVLAIALRLTDVGGRNVSGPAIVVHAQDIDTTRSVGNPITSGGSNFPYVRAVNAYALLAIEPVALGKGTHILHFTAGADPTVHTITFTTH